MATNSWWKPGATGSASTSSNKPQQQQQAAASAQPAAAAAISNWGTQLFGGGGTGTSGKQQQQQPQSATRVPLPSAAPPSSLRAEAPTNNGGGEADSSVVLSSPHVMEMIKSIYLESADPLGYCYQTARVHLRIKPGSPPFDDQMVGLKWFRAAEEGGTFESLNCTEQTFQPSIDDVGKRLCVQCYDLLDETSASFVEYGPVIMDPKVLDQSQRPGLSFVLTEIGTSALTEFTFAGDAPGELVGGGGEVIKLTECWQVVSHMPTQVVVDGMRAFDFGSAADRDVATLALRRRFPPPSELKQLRERVRELDTQLQIALKKTSMSETGKALAEIQASKREADKSKALAGKLQQELDACQASKKKLEDQLAATTAASAAPSSSSSAQAVQARVQQLEELCRLREEEVAQLQHELGQRAQQMAELPQMHIKVGTAAKRIGELELKLNAAQEESQRLAGRKNATAQKADSLAKDMARLLRLCPGGVEEVDAVQRENARLKQMLAELRAEAKLLRQHQAPASATAQGSTTANQGNPAGGGGKPPLFGVSLLPLGLKNLGGGGGGGGLLGGGAAPAGGQGKDALGALANSLVLEVRAKDEQLDLLQSTIDRLNIRNAELVRRLRDRGGEMTE